MKKWFKMFWPYLTLVVFWIIVGLLVYSLFGCDRALKKEIEQLREELTKNQQYVPLKRDTIRDSVVMVTQKIVEVEKIKEVLSDEDKALLKDMGAKISAIESYQKIGTSTMAEVTLQPDTNAANERLPPADSLLTFKDAWMDLKYNNVSKNLSIRFQDSLSIAVEKEFKKKFLWWKWGTKGYQVKAVSLCPYTTIRYNTYVKVKR